MDNDDSETLPILIRAYSTDLLGADNATKKKRGKKGRRVPPIGPAKTYLVFDTETTTDAAMRCRLGFYQLHLENGGSEEKLFFDPCEAFPGDTEIIHAYAAARNLPIPITLEDFRDVLLVKRRPKGTPDRRPKGTPWRKV